MKKVLATITAYKNRLVFELKVNESSSEVTTSIDNPGRFGQVVANTREYLGISAAALALLNTVPTGSDSLGDVDWFQSADGADVFGWIGGPFSIKDPAQCEAARGFKIRSHLVIPNAPAQGAMDAIDVTEQELARQ